MVGGRWRNLPSEVFKFSKYGVANMTHIKSGIGGRAVGFNGGSIGY